jgi:hypothetical protein
MTESQDKEKDADQGGDGCHNARRFNDLLLKRAEILLNRARQMGDPANSVPIPVAKTSAYPSRCHAGPG